MKECWGKMGSSVVVYFRVNFGGNVLVTTTTTSTISANFDASFAPGDVTSVFEVNKTTVTVNSYQKVLSQNSKDGTMVLSMDPSDIITFNSITISPVTFNMHSSKMIDEINDALQINQEVYKTSVDAVKDGIYHGILNDNGRELAENEEDAN